MTALQIEDVKGFMSHLLLYDTFDRFLTVEGTIVTCNTFVIDGHIQKDFYTEEEIEEKELADRTFSYWQDLKPLCLSLIKGKKTPLGFKFVFQLSAKNTEKLLLQTGLSLTSADINGLLLTVKYDGVHLSCTTGTSLRLFTLDKSLEHAWDLMVQKFFSRNEIEFIKF